MITRVVLVHTFELVFRSGYDAPSMRMARSAWAYATWFIARFVAEVVIPREQEGYDRVGGAVPPLVARGLRELS